MDIGIAVTATGFLSEPTFRHMKGVIKELTDSYGYGEKVRYGLIIFGERASTKLSFTDEYASLADLQRFVEVAPRIEGGPRLDRALEEAEKLFVDNSKPSAKKIFLVFTNKNSTGNQNEEKAKVDGLKKKGIATIVTSWKADVGKSFEKLVPKEQIVVTDTGKDPSEVVKKVIDEIDHSKCFNLSNSAVNDFIYFLRANGVQYEKIHISIYKILIYSYVIHMKLFSFG